MSLEEQELIAGPAAPPGTAPDPPRRVERPAGADRLEGVLPRPADGASDSFWSFGGPPRAARRRRFAEEID